MHHLGAVVSPNFPVRLLRWGAIAIGLVNVAVYTRGHAHAHHKAIQLRVHLQQKSSWTAMSEFRFIIH
jgi:hypothetical protein